MFHCRNINIPCSCSCGLSADASVLSASVERGCVGICVQMHSDSNAVAMMAISKQNFTDVVLRA